MILKFSVVSSPVVSYDEGSSRLRMAATTWLAQSSTEKVAVRQWTSGATGGS